MKKRNYVIAAAGTLALALTACGTGAKEQTTTAVETTADSAETTAEAASSEEAGETETTAEETETETAAEITKEDAAAFTDEVEDAVMNKNIKSLAEMVTFPVYVASVVENEGVVADKEAFLAISKDALFTEAFVDAVTAFDSSTIEKVEAGYVIGEGALNVIFNVDEKGNLGITGINNK